jgi:hypothetical protein
MASIPDWPTAIKLAAVNRTAANSIAAGPLTVFFQKTLNEEILPSD